MTKPLLVQKSKKQIKFYDLNQCALYRVGSKSRLAALLGIELRRLIFLASQQENYRIFLLPEQVCPFTAKVTKERWVQEPTLELRRIHERLQKLLRQVTPFQYAHAAVKGRSYRSNAVAHIGANRLATFDVRKFYPSTLPSHVYNFFAEKLLCEPDVAVILTKLTCYQNGLPTGSPLSPLLSLYANSSMFEELNQLAVAHSLTFTCYVDDLTFSGNSLPKGLAVLVSNIVKKHGHQLADTKTRFFRQGQSKHVTGCVLIENAISVPNIRFKKARAIATAIDNAPNAAEKLSLHKKLVGLYGEAKFLDSRFTAKAKLACVNLKIANENAKREMMYNDVP